MFGQIFQWLEIIENIGEGREKTGKREGGKIGREEGWKGERRENGKTGKKCPRTGAFMEAKRLPLAGLAWCRTLDLGVCV